MYNYMNDLQDLLYINDMSEKEQREQIKRNLAESNSNTLEFNLVHSV